MNIGIADSNLAELLAVVEVLSIIMDVVAFPLPRIILESDSSNVISCITKSDSRPWKFSNLFNRLSNLLEIIGHVTFVYIFREANFFADSLAKLGVSRISNLIAWL